MYFTFESFMAFLDEPLDTPMGDRYYNYYESYAYEADINPQTGEEMNPIAARLRTIIQAVINFLTKSIPKFFNDLFAKSPEARNDASTQAILKAINEKSNDAKNNVNWLEKATDFFIQRSKTKQAKFEMKANQAALKNTQIAAKNGSNNTSNIESSSSSDNANQQEMIRNVTTKTRETKLLCGAIKDLATVAWNKWGSNALDMPKLDISGNNK